MACVLLGRVKTGWMVNFSFFILLLTGILFIYTNAFAAIPLITDDTGVMGKGKSQVELAGEYRNNREDGVTSKETNLSMTFSYGIVDQLDIYLSVPYQFVRAEDDELTQKMDGFSDVSIEAKWRFFEKNGFSMALKPGLTLPTGNEEKDLGHGRSTYYLYFITSKEIKQWLLHLNLAYIRHENKGDDRNDLWRASLASTFEVAKNLKLVGDVGVASNPEKSSAVLQAYILGGFIYSLRENCDIGLGIKGGLTNQETDISLRGGITWRF
jgi:hypothetical protein